MARKRRPNERPSYQRAPRIPAETSARYEVIAEVLGGRMTVSEGARRLQMARVNFQTLVHRAQAAMLDSLAPRPSGPPPRPARETALESEVERLAKQKEKLEHQLASMDRLLEIASEVIQDLRRPAARTSARRSRRSTSSSSASEPEDPEPAALLAKVATVAERGDRVARAVGCAPATLRRWRARATRGCAPRRLRGGRRRALDEGAAAKVRALVRDLEGLVGAASLARSVEGGVAAGGGRAQAR
jgi:hypothetical protein